MLSFERIFTPKLKHTRIMKGLFNLNALAIILFSFFIIACAASKVKVSPYVGNWEYTFPSQDGGEVDATMTITEIENGFSGVLSSEMGSVDLEDLVIEEGKLSAKFEIQGYEISMNGGFDGDTYTGIVDFDGNEFPMNATKKQAADQ